eukprot:Mrub_05856.p1 GENE.Mrub_05856~~Mrub_05856.p1  ORF type:complete len:130 (+),score=41.61 Mrub_05856:317-706(+)
MLTPYDLKSIQYTDIPQDKESDSESDGDQIEEFKLDTEAMSRANLKVNADAQMNAVPEEYLQDISRFCEENSRRYQGNLDRMQVSAYRDGTMTVVEPALAQLLKSNMKSNKEEHAQILRDLLQVGKMSI